MNVVVQYFLVQIWAVSLSGAHYILNEDNDMYFESHRKRCKGLGYGSCNIGVLLMTTIKFGIDFTRVRNPTQLFDVCKNMHTILIAIYRTNIRCPQINVPTSERKIYFAIARWSEAETYNFFANVARNCVVSDSNRVGKYKETSMKYLQQRFWLTRFCFIFLFIAIDLCWMEITF